MQQAKEMFSAQIEVKGLVKRYHHQAVLDRLSLTIDDGEFCVLIGANGAGKTTLLRILATLARPDQGQIRIGGALLGTTPAIRRMIGYVGHQTMLYADLNAVENLKHYAQLYQIRDPGDKIANALQLTGLAPYQNKPIRSFSRGMKQRLSIVRSLLHDPHILLLDEPYTGLDQEAAQFLDGTLSRLHRSEYAILLAAHHPGYLLSLASHIAWLKDGSIDQHLSVDHLSSSPELKAYIKGIT